MLKISLPTPRRYQAQVREHLLSLAWFGDHYEVAYHLGSDRWSDPIWAGPECEGRGALLAARHWLEKDEFRHPEEIASISWVGNAWEVSDWEDQFEIWDMDD